MNKRKPRVQVELMYLPGSEPWLRVVHSKGCFTIPGDARAEEILRGALEGWNKEARDAARSTNYVRVPMAMIVELEAKAAALEARAALAAFCEAAAEGSDQSVS